MVSVLWNCFWILKISRYFFIKYFSSVFVNLQKLIIVRRFSTTMFMSVWFQKVPTVGSIPVCLKNHHQSIRICAIFGISHMAEFWSCTFLFKVDYISVRYFTLLLIFMQLKWKNKKINRCPIIIILEIPIFKRLWENLKCTLLIMNASQGSH